MKKAVFDLNLSLLISLIIIVFIVSMSITELNYYKIIKENQIFKKDVSNTINTINYLVDNNNIKGFKEVKLNIPSEQYLLFDNISETIKIVNNSFNLTVNLINFLNLSSGEYTIMLCYDCNVSKEYLVRFK